MRWFSRSLAVALAAIAVSASAPDASAGFILTNPTVPKPPPPIFTPIPILDPIFFWEIDVWFVGTAGGSRLVQNESYFTFYDIKGLTVGSNSQPGIPHPFAASFALLGRTPDPAPSGLVDDPTLMNITYFYSGNNTINVAEGVSIYLGKFSFQSNSSFADVPRSVQFVSRSPTRNGGQETGFEIVPVSVVVPEPASLAMVVPGALLLGAIVRRRRRLV